MRVYPLVRDLLFHFDAELVHHLTLSTIGLAGKISPVAGILRLFFTLPPQPVECFGLTFPNRLGLAAGYDKDGTAYRGLACLGFGHIEVGTVTLRPQPGNPKPRLFRLPEAQALINRMGFPGKGAKFVASQLGKSRSPELIIGVNLGKNKDTPLERAVEDYLALFDIFAPLSDYLAINVSSPNTIGLRQLQARQALEKLLRSLKVQRQQSHQKLGRRIPILVKIAPDLDDRELDDVLDVVEGQEMDGVIATNTTIQRHGLVPDVLKMTSVATESGGLSGLPLFSLSLSMVRKIRQRGGNRLPIIGVGGIMSADHAKAMLGAGADLLQIYTALVYGGPTMVKQLLRGL